MTEPIDGEIPEAFRPVSEETARGIEDGLLKSGFPPALASLVVTYLTETGPAWASCPHCRRRVQVELPVQKYREKMLDKIIDHLVGKPLEKKQVTINVQTSADLEKLSDDELHAFLAANS